VTSTTIQIENGASSAMQTLVLSAAKVQFPPLVSNAALAHGVGFRP
jgi:hypothetical protein